jgi:hypothetical protein
VQQDLQVPIQVIIIPAEQGGYEGATWKLQYQSKQQNDSIRMEN